MKLKATVKAVTGKTKHYIASQLPLNKATSIEFLSAAWVEIEQQDNGYSLFRYTSANEFAGDSWFVTLEEAKRQAKFEFEIEEDDWETVNDC